MAYRTPDVYIEEISVFPPSVAEVQTAVPAFIGYTEIATRNNDDDLRLKPTKIYSMQEYEQYFGGPQKDYGDTQATQLLANVTEDADGNITNVDLQEPKLTYLLHYAMKMFFDNGGGQCYVISVDGYKVTSPSIVLSNDNDASVGLMDGLEKLKNEDEPTLIVIPEATQLAEDSAYKTLTEAMLKQCNDLQDRFAVIDLRGGHSAFVSHDAGATSVEGNNSQQRNRELLGANNLKYGATYYPFLKTGINYFVDREETMVQVKVGAAAAADLVSFATDNTAVYNAVKSELKRHYVKLPPSSAVVGVYAATDEARGVWKAPANVGINNVVEPLIKIDNAIQGEMNIDATSGKSINAIRSFAGKGTLVWGARTLAGNDNEWRYTSVRRLFITIEESVKKSTYWAVFEPNDANTWVKVRGMIENYLTLKWREGALAGAVPQDAFFVRCGLGATMNSQDILEGRMNVEIGMAAVRPAEFIILKFSHLLQTS
jgi:phage tail sheath protein FI